MAHEQKWLSGRVNGYTPGTLENNWNEERFDIKYLKESKPLPSQFSHAYNTTYQDLCVNHNSLNFQPEDAVTSAKYRVTGYPGHQPEMDPEYYKQRINTYETDHRVNYLDPRLKKFPFDFKKMMNDEIQKKRETAQSPAIIEPQKFNGPPAPIVELDKVFSDEPGNRYYKALIDSKPKLSVEKPEEKKNVDNSQPTCKIEERNPKHDDERDDLSNFEKLMIRINRKKGIQSENDHREAVIEQTVEIENQQQEKTTKTVRWEDQN